MDDNAINEIRYREALRRREVLEKQGDDAAARFRTLMKDIRGYYLQQDADGPDPGGEPDFEHVSTSGLWLLHQFIHLLASTCALTPS
jgi:hypothetical protein